MKAIKRLISGGCALVMMAAATGCGSEPVVTTNDQQVEISFSWWGNDDRNRYTLEAIEKFEETYPNIKVNCNYSEWSGYELRNKVWLISDTESDVMQINYGWIDTYSPDGLGYYDINQLSQNIRLDNFSDEQLAYGISADKLNAVPIAMNAETVYINKSKYDEYGLDVPKTWDDLFAAAEVMSKDGIYPMSAASKAMWLYLIAYTEQTSGKHILTDDGQLGFKAEDFQVMFDFYQKLLDNKVMPQVELYERLNLDSEQYAGAVAWVSDAQNYFGDAVENGREIVVADYTTIDGSNPGAGWYAKPATMYAISADTPHPEEAALLLDFLLNSDDMAELQGLEKGIPLSKAARTKVQNDGLLTGIQYEASEAMSDVTMGQMAPVLENGDLIDEFFAAANEVIYDKADGYESANAFYTNMKENYF